MTDQLAKGGNKAVGPRRLGMGIQRRSSATRKEIGNLWASSASWYTRITNTDTAEFSDLQ